MADQQKMIEKHLKDRDITDPKVLMAMWKVKRHEFVDEDWLENAYSDTPLPIGFGQTISQPYVVAYMTQALELKDTDKVLEIGTGSGYQAAVLSEIVKEVYTLEVVQSLAEQAKKRLKDLGYNNVTVKHGDGYLGWEEEQPFDAIIATAAPKTVPEALLNQLKIGGKMIVPVGESYDQSLKLIIKTNEGYSEKVLIPVRFVPMVKKE